MRVEQPGPVTLRITLMGRNESCVYLVDGKEEYAILGGGMTYIVPDLMTQIKAAGIDEKKISRLIIHHSHFDHLGIVPYVKKRWPWIKISASARAAELLSRKDVVASIASLNLMLLPDQGAADLKESLGIQTIEIDEILSQGDEISCGDLGFKMIEVPGHSSCSMASYLFQEKAMFASDAGGIPYGDHVFAAANSNFDDYQASLEKLAAYETRVHLSEHYGALTGEEGHRFISRSIEAAAKMRELLETTYARYQDEKKTVKALVEIVSSQASGYFLPKEVMAMVLCQMTRFIAKQYSA
ncbi:MAG: MBL fold metallo-hydrolase [Desulfobacter sp.]|nr:MBL fold metallo-hydrolase [Desulfobacter sp.]